MRLWIRTAGQAQSIRAVVFGQPGRIACVRIVLWGFIRAAFNDAVQRRKQESRAQRREVPLDLVARFIEHDRAADDRQHRPRIERSDDAHDGNARLPGRR